MDDLGATSHCKETAIYIMGHTKDCATSSFGLITFFFYFGELCQKCPLKRGVGISFKLLKLVLIICTSSLINIIYMYVKIAYQNGWLAVFCVEPLTAVGVRSIAARVAKTDKRTLAVQTISSVRFNSFTYVHGIEENNADKKEKTEKNTVTLRDIESLLG